MKETFMICVLVQEAPTIASLIYTVFLSVDIIFLISIMIFLS